jgi:hypothetical protein
MIECLTTDHHLIDASPASGHPIPATFCQSPGDEEPGYFTLWSLSYKDMSRLSKSEKIEAGLPSSLANKSLIRRLEARPLSGVA